MKYQPTIVVINKLLRKRVKDENDCWNWTGGKIPDGYGHINFKGKSTLVHRLIAHICLSFDLESDLKVMHKCDNPACFNPIHLKIGTHAENMKDMSNKSRGVGKQPSTTHCRRGHEYNVVGIYIHTDGTRRCLECRNSWYIRKKKVS